MTPVQADHEGLALAHVLTSEGSVLVACSVMPGRGAQTSWPGDPTARHAVRFADALHEHLTAIQQARRGGQAIVWGGDFNQALTGRETAGSLAGRALLLEAFASLDLRPTTADLAHRIDGIMSIDHIAVPATWAVKQRTTQMPVSDAGKPLSDHALYVVEATPPT
jgi:hypothetical protein